MRRLEKLTAGKRDRVARSFGLRIADGKNTFPQCREVRSERCDLRFATRVQGCHTEGFETLEARLAEVGETSRRRDEGVVLSASFRQQYVACQQRFRKALTKLLAVLLRFHIRRICRRNRD